MKQKKSFVFKVSLTFAVVLLIVVGGFLLFVSKPYEPASTAIDQLQSDADVKVTKNAYLYFEPVAEARDIGFIFYPGAKVEAAAYATMAKEIATHGYPVIIADFPFNLAILSPNRAANIIDEHPEIKKWVMGGHSLGGVMAADYALDHDEVEGLVLLASYPQQKTDLRHASINVLSIWGSHDEVADLDKVKDAKDRMPNDAEFIEIIGGNHGGFGEYGHQKGDGDYTLSEQEQIENTASYILTFLAGI